MALAIGGGWLVTPGVVDPAAAPGLVGWPYPLQGITDQPGKKNELFFSAELPWRLLKWRLLTSSVMANDLEADVAEGFDLLCGVVDFDDTTGDDDDEHRPSATHPWFRRSGEQPAPPPAADRKGNERNSAPLSTCTGGDDAASSQSVGRRLSATETEPSEIYSLNNITAKGEARS